MGEKDVEDAVKRWSLQHSHIELAVANSQVLDGLVVFHSACLQVIKLTVKVGGVQYAWHDAIRRRAYVMIACQHGTAPKLDGGFVLAYPLSTRWWQATRRHMIKRRRPLPRRRRAPTIMMAKAQRGQAASKARCHA